MFGKKKKAEGALEEAKNWYADRYQNITIQRNFLALVTLISLAGLVATTLIGLSIVESRTFEPYVIEIEDKTGIATLLERNTVETYQADEAVIRYFVFKYIQARESYDVDTYTHDYGQVARTLSTSDVYRKFRQWIAVENPQSPLNLGRTSTRKVELKSMTFLESKKVQARVLITDYGNTGHKTHERHAIIILSFDFLDLELKPNERYINPLGFQILSYRIDEEIAE